MYAESNQFWEEVRGSRSNCLNYLIMMTSTKHLDYSVNCNTYLFTIWDIHAPSFFPFVFLSFFPSFMTGLNVWGLKEKSTSVRFEHKSFSRILYLIIPSISMKRTVDHVSSSTWLLIHLFETGKLKNKFDSI